MGLPTSGNLSILDTSGTTRSIAREVDGNVTAPKHLATLGSTAGKSSPYDMTDFYGYSNIEGEVWGQNDSLTAARTHGSVDGLESSNLSSVVSLRWYPTANQNCKVVKSTGSNFSAGDQKELKWYRRGVDASTWVLQNTISGYFSTTVTCDFATYDYRFDLDEDSCLTGENNLFIGPNELKNIKEFKVGDVVYTAPEYDPYMFDYFKVSKVKVVKSDKIRLISFDTGYQLKCSDTHKLMTANDEGVFLADKIKSMQPGMRVLRLADDYQYKFSLITAIEELPAEDVYKIEVEKAHTYFTDDQFYHHNTK